MSTVSGGPQEPATPQDAAAQDARPVLRIVRGNATAEEIAALVTVLAARGGGDDGAPPAPVAVNHWADGQARLRRPLAPGGDAWRASAWQR